MDSDWLRAYMLLALGLNKLIMSHMPDLLLLDYHGPLEYQAQVDGEPAPTAKRLLQDAQTLQESLADQDFAPARKVYLGKLQMMLSGT